MFSLNCDIFGIIKHYHKINLNSEPTHYSVSAFQARSLDIVTQVVEPFEDFLAVEKVAQRVEVFRDV